MSLLHRVAVSQGWLKREITDIFAVDLRSLALVRIFVALIVLVDLATRAPYMAMFYGDGSVVPSSLLHSFWMGEWAWSLHVLFGGPTALVTFLFALHAVFALALLIGFRTRFATIGTWFLLVSLHNADPLILLGGDFLLRAVLFVGIFLPWGTVFSLDARGKAPTSMRLVSAWGAAYLVQIGLVYYFAAMYKNSIEWDVTGSALYYIASFDQYATPLSTFLVQFPDFLRIATFGIVILQHLVIFLLFFPLFNRYIRTLLVVLLIGMHVVFGLASHLGMFSWISVAALLGLLPSFVWEKTALLRGRITQETAASTVRTRGLVSALGILYIVYIFLWQAAEFAPLARIPGWQVWSVPAKVLQIDQRWNLFAPQPDREDGWDVVVGRLRDGHEVDLFRGGVTPSFERPLNLFAHYHASTRTRQYFIGLRRSFGERFRPQYAQYVCREWNSTHAGEERLISLEHVYMVEWTSAPGLPKPPPEKRTLYVATCE